MSATAAPATPTPATTGVRPFRFTRDQYYKLGELGFFQGKRVELLFGEVFEMSPIGWPHRVATGLVSDALGVAFPTGFVVDVQQPFPVPGAAFGAEPQPDVAVIAGTRRGGTGHPTTAALLVEVADSTLDTDVTEKAELYATAGVADYWVLDLNGRRLLVFRDPVALPAGLGATAYRTQLTLNPTDRVSPLAAPTASILVSDLLP